MRYRRRVQSPISSGVAGLLACLAFGGALGCGAGMGGRPDHGVSVGNGGKPQCGMLGAACVAQKLDAPIAVGGVLDLDLRYQIAGSSGPPSVIESADPTVLRVEGGSRVRAIGPGASAVLFLGPDRGVLDFLHLWTQTATELRVVRYTPQGTALGRVTPSFKLLAKDEILVSVEPYANGQPLAGNFELQRKLQGTSVGVVPDSVGGWYRIVARAVGTTEIAFSALGLSTTLSVEVEP